MPGAGDSKEQVSEPGRLQTILFHARRGDIFDQAKEITHHYRGDGKSIRSLFDFADVSFETQIEQEGDEVFLT